MANYSEEFLNALSRASSSVKGLMDTIKEPDWREKIDYETAAQIRAEQARLTTAGSEDRKTIGFEDKLQYGSREHASSLNINEATYNQKLEKGLMEFKSALTKDEMREASSLTMREMGYGAKLTQAENARLSEYKKKEYEAARDADYEMQAGDWYYRNFGFGKEGLISIEADASWGNTQKQMKLQQKYDRVNARLAHKDRLEEITVTADLTKDQALFEHELNKDAEAMMDYLLRGRMTQEHEQGMEMANLGASNQAQIDALRSIMEMDRMNLDAELKMIQLGQEMDYDREKAGFTSLAGFADVDFGDVTAPRDSWWPMEGREGMGMATARNQFSGMLALYRNQIPGALQSKKVNPESYAIQEALRDADKAAETATNLYNFALDQGFDDDAAYFANAIDYLKNEKIRLTED